MEFTEFHLTENHFNSIIYKQQEYTLIQADTYNGNYMQYHSRIDDIDVYWRTVR